MHTSLMLSMLYVIIDSNNRIAYLQSGFPGYENDGATFAQLPAIGPGRELNFPNDLCILGDSVYPCRYPVLISYRNYAIARQAPMEQRRGRKFNRLLRECMFNTSLIT